VNRPSFIREEPVVTSATVLSLVAAVLMLMRAFGVLITDDQHDAILNVVAIGGPILAAIWTRRQVSPTP